MITVGEMRNMSLEELLKELSGAQHNLFRYRFTVRAGTEKNISLLRQWKKQVAQIQTIISEFKKSDTATSRNKSEDSQLKKAADKTKVVSKKTKLEQNN